MSRSGDFAGHLAGGKIGVGGCSFLFRWWIERLIGGFVGGKRRGTDRDLKEPDGWRFSSLRKILLGIYELLAYY